MLCFEEKGTLEELKEDVEEYKEVREEFQWVLVEYGVGGGGDGVEGVRQVSRGYHISAVAEPPNRTEVRPNMALPKPNRTEPNAKAWFGCSAEKYKVFAS